MNKVTNDEPSLPTGYQIRVFDELDSTNQEARRLAEDGAQGNVWVMAHKQTSGRGRRGRIWQSYHGNLMASLLLRTKATSQSVSAFSFVAALAVADAVEKMSGQKAQLKWPNDVLVGNEKIAGILLESVSAGSAPPGWLVVGVGLNLAHAPEGLPYPATAISRHTGQAPEPEAALSLLAWAWAAAYETWQQEGFAAIRAAWLERAMGLGERAMVSLPHEQVVGVFRDLAEDGAMLLDTDAGMRAISAGDVFFEAKV